MAWPSSSGNAWTRRARFASAASTRAGGSAGRWPAPAEARSDEELAEIAKRVNGELALPEAYRAEWGQTEAALLRARRLEDVKALQAAVGRVEDWYRDLKRRGEALWSFSDRSGREG